MGRKHKLNVTRPEFLLRMMSDGDVDRLDDDNMKKALYDTSTLSYVVYTVLMEANLKQSDIYEVTNDGESIAVRLESKGIAKKTAEICNKEQVRFGHHMYKVHVKVRDKYLVFTMDQMDDDEEE